jgi:hypothetical protein
LFKLAAVRAPTLANRRAALIELTKGQSSGTGNDSPEISDPATGNLLDLEPGDGDSFKIPLAALDERLSSHNDSVDGADLVAFIQEKTGHTLNESLQDPRWAQRRETLADLILTAPSAAGAVAKGEFREANSWLRALRVMALLELLAQLDTTEVGNGSDSRRGPKGDRPPELPLRALPSRNLLDQSGITAGPSGGIPGELPAPRTSRSTSNPGRRSEARAPTDGTVTMTGADVQFFLRYSVIGLPKDAVPSPKAWLARPPAIADLKKVKLGPARYEPGAIAHIENVMASEKRTREHRLHEENEQTTTTESERIEERAKDLSTASNVAMQHMATETLSSSTDVEAGVNVSASYGPTVSVELNGSVARHDSAEATNQASRSISNQITQSAREKVVERFQEQHVNRRLVTTDELNLHGFENVDAGAVHIRGVYRYVNQVQDAWMENYGKRLMLEFVVPQPSRMLRWAQRNKQTQDTVEPEPTWPTSPADATKLLSPEAITPDNYLALTGKHGAANVTAPPAATLEIGVSHKVEKINEQLYLFADHNTLVVPDGYVAMSWSAQCVAWDTGGTDNAWLVGVGDDADPSEGPKTVPRHVSGLFTRAQQSKIPVIMLGRGLIGFAASVTVHCDRTDAALDTWKLKVFDAVMTAWRHEHDAWEATRLRADARAHAEAVTAPINGADNPELNRALERREMRRCVVTMLFGEDPDKGTFAKDTITEDTKSHRPQMELKVVADHSPGIQFLEQAFEWNNMTYVHYPYYWSASNQWAEAITTTAVDPLWAAFLSAGASRVAVPVRPGFESVVALYLATGVMWLGGQVPSVGEPGYLGIADEIAESLGTGTVEPQRTPLDPVVLPTPLIWLQPTGDLNPQEPQLVTHLASRHESGDIPGDAIEADAAHGREDGTENRERDKSPDRVEAPA